MKTIIRSAAIIDPRSKHHGQKKDILVDRGKIVEIASSIKETVSGEWKHPGLMVSPGWIDMKANFCDPGHEYKEDLDSGVRAAAKGGFAKVVLVPSTQPVIDNKTQVEYITARSKKYNQDILPCGTISQKLAGKQLSEMYDMHLAGAVAFTDDKAEVHTELMTRALDYARNFDGLIISFPHDPGVSEGGQVHEGPHSVSIGLKGIPHVAEEMRIARDIDLLRYTGGRLHFSLISSARSVELIRKAKKEGLNLTCSVAAHQLAFTDEDMLSFDSNLKVMPPFRSATDRKALIQGLRDGTIDAVCSDHTPEDVEHKVREFEYAEFGISSIEVCFGVAYTALEKQMSVEQIVALFTSGPSKILRIDQPVIEEGNAANMTIFSTDEDTRIDEKGWQSKSMNTPFMGKILRSKVYGVVC